MSWMSLFMFLLVPAFRRIKASRPERSANTTFAKDATHVSVNSKSLQRVSDGSEASTQVATSSLVDTGLSTHDIVNNTIASAADSVGSGFGDDRFSRSFANVDDKAVSKFVNTSHASNLHVSSSQAERFKHDATSLRAMIEGMEADLGLDGSSREHVQGSHGYEGNMLHSVQRQHLGATASEQQFDSKMDTEELSMERRSAKQTLQLLGLQRRKVRAEIEQLESQMREEYKVLQHSVGESAETKQAASPTTQGTGRRPVQSTLPTQTRAKEDNEFAKLEDLTGHLSSWLNQIKQLRETHRSMAAATRDATDKAMKLGFTPGEIAKAAEANLTQTAGQAPHEEPDQRLAQVSGAVGPPPLSPNLQIDGMAMKMAEHQVDVADFNLAAHEFMKTAKILKDWNKKGDLSADSLRRGSELQQQLEESLRAIQKVEENVRLH